MIVNFSKLLFLFIPVIMGSTTFGVGDDQKLADKLEYQSDPSKNDKKVDLNFENAHPNAFQYNNGLSSLFPEIQDEKFGSFSEKQTFPRIQPQVFLYPGNFAPGQQFLLQPATPPNNFLIPQPHPGTDIILQDIPHFFPPNGYPRPANTPPVEKDAEEIPTDQIGVHQPNPKNKDKKPEKLETFDIEEEKVVTETEVLKGNNKKHHKPATSNLKPGERFFFLNGQTLFPNFEGLQNDFLDPFKIFELSPHSPEKQVDERSDQTPFFFDHKHLEDVHKKAITGEKNDKGSGQQRFGFFYPDNSILLNQPVPHISHQGLKDITIPTLHPSSSAKETKDGETKETEKEQEKITSPHSSQFGVLPNRYSLLGSDVDHVFGNGHFPGFYDFNSFHPQKDTHERNAEEINANEEKDNNGTDDFQANAPKNGNPTFSQPHQEAISVSGNDDVASVGPKATSKTGEHGTAKSQTATAGSDTNIFQKKILYKRPRV